MTIVKTSWIRTTWLMACAAILFAVSGLQAQQRPDLGKGSTYAIFTGGGAINSTGLTKLTGDVGQDGDYEFNGFPPGTYTGTLNRNNAATALVKADLLKAWTAEALVACDKVIGVGIVDGQSFDPGVHCTGAASTTTGNITFNAQGDPDAIFIVKIGGQLDANSGTKILLDGGARAANIYWFVDGAVNVASNSAFKGTIFARGAISFASGSSLDGKALAAPAGAITLSANNVAISTDTGVVNNLVVVKPAKGDTIKGGTQNYLITWKGVGIAQSKILEYSLDSGMTWKRIDSINTSALTYSWNLPDTTSNKARVRITDKNNLRGVSGVFVISGLMVVKPMAGDTLRGGMLNYQITWKGAGITRTKVLEYSLDNGLTWKLIDTLKSDAMSYSWNVPDTSSKNALVRVTDQNNLRGVSGVFVISARAPGNSITVIRPTQGETIVAGTQNYQITWISKGIGATKTFELSLDGGMTWKTIGTQSTDAMAFSWNVPDTNAPFSVIRITDNNGLTGMSGVFSITRTVAQGSIVVVRPAAGEVIAGGTQNYMITFEAVNTTPNKRLDYSLDGGANWNLIGFLNAQVLTYTWATVPNVATTEALVRIVDANGITGISGLFTITETAGVGTFNSLTLTGLDANRNIGNNKVLGISWTYTPDIGPFVKVEVSLDGMLTWIEIANNPVAITDAAYTTPMTGRFDQVYVRVTSTNGMTLTSLPFSIGSNASVYAASKDGYSVSNYPNPAVSQTTINAVLPVAGNVTLTVFDELGRSVIVLTQHLDAGSNMIPINISDLIAGNYFYTLQSGTIRVAGQMSVIR